MFKNAFKIPNFQNWFFMYGILLAVPILLIMAYIGHAENLLQYPGFNLFITSWIHYGVNFLEGNVLGWLILFSCLTLMTLNIERIKRTVIFAILGLPLFSSLVELGIYGKLHTGSWGFSGILFAIYGVIIFFTMAGLQYYLKDKEISAPLKGGIFLITIITALSPLLTPSVVGLQNKSFLLIDTLGHQLGIIWGLIVCILVYRDKKELEVKYWIIGLLAIIIQAVSFAGYWL